MIVLVNGVVEEKNIKSDLFSLFGSMDSDINGDNDTEKQKAEYMKQGVSCKLDLYINKVIEDNLSVPMAVVEISEMIANSSYVYRDSKVMESDSINGKKAYAVAFISEC